MTIPLEMVGAGFALALLGFVLGFVLGLWFGERGRRRDMQWFTNLQGALNPSSSSGDKPDLVDSRSLDMEAMQRAEVAGVIDGLREEIRNDGGAMPTDEQLHHEALRLVSQYHVEPAEAL